MWVHKHFARDSPERIHLIKRVPVKNPKPGKSPPSKCRVGRGEEDYAQYVLPERIEDKSGDVGARDGSAFTVPPGFATGRHPAPFGPGAGMMHGWDERAQMNMMNHMMAMQNSMNVMAMNMMAQQRAFGNGGGVAPSGRGGPNEAPSPGDGAAFANPQASGVSRQFMGMGGMMPAFSGQWPQIPMDRGGVQELLAQIDSESLQAALLARAILENRRQDAARAGPGQAQPSGAQDDRATSSQDEAVDGDPEDGPKKFATSQSIDHSIDDLTQQTNRKST